MIEYSGHRQAQFASLTFRLTGAAAASRSNCFGRAAARSTQSLGGARLWPGRRRFGKDEIGYLHFGIESSAISEEDDIGSMKLSNITEADFDWVLNESDDVL